MARHVRCGWRRAVAWSCALAMWFCVVAGSASSSRGDSAAAGFGSEDLLDLTYKQEATITRLQATVTALRAELRSVREQLRLLSPDGASGDALGSGTPSTLKAEVLRLVSRGRREGEVEGEKARAGNASQGGDASWGSSEEDRWREPQHISIVCKDAADVSVRPLDVYDRPNDECLVLEVRAAEVDTRFVLYCDGSGGGGGGGEGG